MHILGSGSIQVDFFIERLNDVQVGDNVEAFEMVEVKRTLGE